MHATEIYTELLLRAFGAKSKCVAEVQCYFNTHVLIGNFFSYDKRPTECGKRTCRQFTPWCASALFFLLVFSTEIP